MCNIIHAKRVAASFPATISCTSIEKCAMRMKSKPLPRATQATLATRATTAAATPATAAATATAVPATRNATQQQQHQQQQQLLMISSNLNSNPKIYIYIISNKALAKSKQRNLRIYIHNKHTLNTIHAKCFFFALEMQLNK